MIVLFTDFGHRGPYVGQVRGVLYVDAPDVPVVELLSDAPAFNPRASAYLLACLAPEFPRDSVFLGVVDPGVGSEQRLPVVLRAGDRWFVGPDNGLFNILARRDVNACWWQITWTPDRLSATFHGRDLFAPVAAMLARGESVPGQLMTRAGPELDHWPEDLWEIIYMDGFGNAITGVRARAVATSLGLRVNGYEVRYARTYAELPQGRAFWYENANGMVEIAVSRGAAADVLGLAVGTEVRPF